MYQKEHFFKECQMGLNAIMEELSALPILRLKDFPAGATAFVVIDMIGGFARQGALYSPFIEALIPNIVSLSKRMEHHGVDCLAFADSHTEASPEFAAYPVHCLKGSRESALVEELEKAAHFKIFPKNSTNGFLTADFQSYLHSHSKVKNFILAGDCTDICVLQFAVTLKAWFNEQNLSSRVIVPADMVDTYDLKAHNRILMNAVSLFQMQQSGIEVVGCIH